MKANNQYKRQAQKNPSTARAEAPRAHAHEPAGDSAKKANPQRRDVLARHMIAARKLKQDNNL
jgi:hypothetical protein